MLEFEGINKYVYASYLRLEPMEKQSQGSGKLKSK
jgi:hypothetical protein